MLSLDAFRAEFMGRQWGLVPIFIPEFQAGISEQVEPTRGLVTLLMLHDVLLWTVYCNMIVSNEAFDALDAFGYVDAEFIPYFDRTPPATTEMKDVYASVYKCADARALVIVGNLSRENRSGCVRLNGERIGVSLENIVTWPERAPVRREVDSIVLDIPGQGYRMLHIGNTGVERSTLGTSKR